MLAIFIFYFLFYYFFFLRCSVFQKDPPFDYFTIEAAIAKSLCGGRKCHPILRYSAYIIMIFISGTLGHLGSCIVRENKNKISLKALLGGVRHVVVLIITYVETQSNQAYYLASCVLFSISIISCLSIIRCFT